jgi:acetyl-CoA C-acetyltransferase
MAFAGGPFNNFVFQATAAMAGALRADPGSLGVVTTVSGLLTKPGLGAWSASPDGQGPLLGDLGAEAARVTGSVEVIETLEEYTGPATVVTYTVTPGSSGAVAGTPALPWSRTVVVADADDGRRGVAISDDPEVAAQAVSGELIGRSGAVKAGAFAL